MGIIEVDKLNLILNKQVILEDICVNFEEGLIYGIVGKNSVEKVCFLNVFVVWFIQRLER